MIRAAALPASSLTNLEPARKITAPAVPGLAVDSVDLCGLPAVDELNPPLPIADSDDDRAAHRLRPLAAVVVAGLVGASLGAALAPAVSSWLAPSSSQSVVQASEAEGATFPTGLIDPGPAPQDGSGHYPTGVVLPEQEGEAPTPGLPDEVPTPALPDAPSRADRSESPTAVLWMASTLAETASQQLPQALEATTGWSGDLAAIQGTARLLLRQTDSVLRDFKGSSPQSKAEVQVLLGQLAEQAGALEQKLGAEVPTSDAFLLEQRNSLNQLGIFSFNLQQQVGQARSHAAPFSAQRQALKAVEGKMSDATTDLAMATEKATESRAIAQALVRNIQSVKQVLSQVGSLQATLDASPSRQQVEQVDLVARLLDQGTGQLQKMLEQERRDVREASGRAHEAAQSLLGASQLLQGQSGASAVPASGAR